MPSTPAPARKNTTASRRIHAAVTSAAIPAVILSSVALAEPATASPVNPVQLRLPGTMPAQLPVTGGASLIAAAKVPALIPSRLPLAKTHTTYTVKAGDTISAIASRHGLNTGKLLQLNGLKSHSLIFPGQKITLGGSAPMTSHTTKPAPSTKNTAPKSSGGASYIVRSGDTLSAIAARHNVSLGSILSANRLMMTSIIYPGQKITVSGKSSGGGPTHSPGKTVKPTTPKPSSSARSYTVVPGDTLSAIASRHGISLGTILSANGIRSTDIIRPGQKLALGGTAKVTKTSNTAPQNLVPSSFLNYTYPEKVVAQANVNKQTLNSMPAPTQEQMKAIIADTARQLGVDPALALAFSYQESGFNQRAVSPANAIGAMQVIPSSGQWASDLVGRKLNLLNPQDNATAGVAIIRALVRTSKNLDIAIASYYQGQYSVSKHGMYDDTKNYVRSVKSHVSLFR